MSVGTFGAITFRIIRASANAGTLSPIKRQRACTILIALILWGLEIAIFPIKPIVSSLTLPFLPFFCMASLIFCLDQKIAREHSSRGK